MCDGPLAAEARAGASSPVSDIPARRPLEVLSPSCGRADSVQNATQRDGLVWLGAQEGGGGAAGEPCRRLRTLHQTRRARLLRCALPDWYTTPPPLLMRRLTAEAAACTWRSSRTHTARPAHPHQRPGPLQQHVRTEPKARRRPEVRCLPTGRERTGSLTLQRHQDPILLLPWRLSKP
jgi:hypothetical protein